jgi:hypothetical protein|tara:strand:+ start:103 stop:483 length:381 start_codon:yes stop_codon:yes gene_type:complete
MGFKSSIQGLVKSAFVTIGDIAEPIIYTSIVQNQYDVFTGQISNTNTEYTFNAVVKYGTLQSNKVSGNDTETDFTGDIEIMFASEDLAIEPSTQDTITRNSEIYSINRITSDAVKATYTLNLVRLG